MAQSIVPLVVVLLAGSLALSNANGSSSGFNNVFCQSKADGLYADCSDSHSFYHCSNSLTYHKQCPANLVFNPAKNLCDWSVGDEVAAATTQGHNLPVVNPIFCQSKADGLYADPSDSHSFYHCSNFLTYHKQCPANLVFNPAISVCDWPGAGAGQVAAATTQGHNIPVVNPVFCQSKADGLYADPSDSHSFYHCSNSQTYHKQCPSNLVFNPAISVCDWPGAGQVAAATTQSHNLPVVNPIFCQSKADGLYADPSDSHSFYHCSNSQTYHKQCPSNLVFNPAISVCDWPGAGEGAGQVAAATTQGHNIPVVNPIFCQSKADGLYADPSDSHSFYHCSNSQTYHKQCPSNLVFNPAISVCDWPGAGEGAGQVAAATTQGHNIPVVNPVFCQSKADGLYADPSDSHSFYHCSNFLTYHKQCPANLVFNPAISVCDWPVVNPGFCQIKADGLYADPSDSHSFYHCSNFLTYHKQCPANLVFNPAVSVCDWPENVAQATTQGITVPPFVANFCEAKADGMFADSQNSNAFYHCSNHNTYHKLCQQGLVFNQGLGACVWPSQGV
uniref:chitinase n=1 Tax=Petromyzon marinus TaxID=7757 RepID=A0AAJ7UHL3_PETMA|nr:chondroitin proteoglycan 2-like isoform X2 [Petromyzon marinus]